MEGNNKHIDGLIKVKPREDLTGKLFGRLLVLRQGPDYIESNGERRPQWVCKCTCGNEVEILALGKALKNGNKKSCGCIKRELLIERNKEHPEYSKKYNIYDLTCEYGIGWTRNTNEKFYFDLSDYELIKDYCWYKMNNGYLQARNKEKKISISRIIMGLNEYDGVHIVDHINGNKLDNRKDNLRVATISQNNMNRRIAKNNKSGITGVLYYEITNKWLASITVNEKCICLGYFENYDDAVKARKEAEDKYFGEFSYDNSQKMREGK